MVLNKKFTFDRFVIGHQNEFACSAAVQVADNPSGKYNPLFIHGNSALGKTHLLQAIAHRLEEKKPDLKCCYTSSEVFANEFIESVKTGSIEVFRRHYRSLDILLIDDIQFFQTRPGAIEEMAFTFNQLFQSGKQLVFASDKPAGSLSFEESIRSKFEAGLSVKIDPPDYETRIKILKAFTAAEMEYIPDDIIEFIAHHIDKDVRALESSLINVAAFSKLKNTELSVDMAREILGGRIHSLSEHIRVKDILKTVSDFYHISVNEMLSDRRIENISHARRIAMYLSKVYTGESLQKIGNEFGNKAHTTVLRSCGWVEGTMKKSKKIKRELEDIRARMMDGVER